MFKTKIKTFEMCEKRFVVQVEHKVLWEFVSAVTEENMKQKQELESTPGLLVDLFKLVKETIQIQKMKRSITKASVKLEASMVDKYR
ncbi:hypothetical protein [Bacillus cereus]|uniref:hypothetical protein n=1 Tax=Bacillus cereus TaxID=1396 RepID=UPI000324C99D|nr:hypothetical protein [Bacillus cereus]MCU0097415.1 hypothetical protein [Bacillus sp. OR9]